MIKKILLTGSTGFIGKHFLDYLLQKKLHVRVLVRNKQKNSFPPEVEICQGDLTQPNSLNNACSGIDTIFHLAGYAHAHEGKNSNFAEQHQLINFQGTKNLLTAAMQEKVNKFIFFSSVKAVADNENCITEDWEAYPTTPYGIAKREAEKCVLAAQHSGMHVTVLRPALVYGPACKGNLASMLAAIDKGLFPPLPKVNNSRSMISVTDLCHAAFLAANHPIANGEIYFVTDKINYSTHQILSLMYKYLEKKMPHWHIPLWFFKFSAFLGDCAKKITGKSLPFNSDTMEKLFGSAMFDSSKIALDLNFNPENNLENMLPAMITAYKNQLRKE